MNLLEFECNVLTWAGDRGIFEKSDSKSQLLKTVAEVGELADAINQNDFGGIEDGIGDVLVTLVLLAKMNGMTLGGCGSCAWAEIKDRKGQMVNGVFVKEEEKRKT